MKRSPTILSLALLLAPSVLNMSEAQESPCGILTMSKGKEVYYPPIARAAHVEGIVVMLVAFKTNGQVAGIQTVYGPELLRGASETVATSLMANSYGGPRICPIVMTYRLRGPKDRECGLQETQGLPSNDVAVKDVDVQHYEVAAENNCLVYQRDPAGRKLKRFHLF